MRQVPEVLAREGGVTASSTRLQDLADGVVFLERRDRAIPRVSRAKGEEVGRVSPIAGKPVILPGEARMRPYSWSAPRLNPRTARKNAPTCPTPGIPSLEIRSREPDSKIVTNQLSKENLVPIEWEERPHSTRRVTPLRSN